MLFRSDLYVDKTPWLYSGLVVHRPFLKDHRDRVKAFLKATVEGNYLAVASADKAKPVLAKELAITDPKIVDITYANFRAETPLNAEPTREGAQNIIDVLAPAKKSVDDYIDESLYNELKAEGFYAAMERKYGKR